MWFRPATYIHLIQLNTHLYKLRELKRIGLYCSVAAGFTRPMCSLFGTGDVWRHSPGADWPRPIATRGRLKLRGAQGTQPPPMKRSPRRTVWRSLASYHESSRSHLTSQRPSRKRWINKSSRKTRNRPAQLFFFLLDIGPGSSQTKSAYKFGLVLWVFRNELVPLVPTMEYTSSPKPQLSSRANAFSIAALMSSGKPKDKEEEESTIKPLGELRPPGPLAGVRGTSYETYNLQPAAFLKPENSSNIMTGWFII